MTYICESMNTATAVRSRTVNELKKYRTVDKAEAALNVSHDTEESPHKSSTILNDMLSLSKTLSTEELTTLSDELFSEVVWRRSLKVPGDKFITKAIVAMKKLQDNGKTNVVYNLAKIVAENRPNSDESLIPLNRMPWGLIQYQIDFFACKHINEVIFLLI